MLRKQRSFVWSDGWYIYVKGDYDFHIIRFDLINVILKCCFSLEFFCFNSAQTNLLEIIFKGCGNSRKMRLLYNKLWWNIDWCFIEHFSSLWEAQCFCVERDHFFFYIFRFLMLFYLEIYILFFLFFKILCRKWFYPTDHIIISSLFWFWKRKISSFLLLY